MDFGTTYSAIVDLNNVRTGKNGRISDYQLNAYSPMQSGSTCIKSIVVKNNRNEKLLCGEDANQARGKRDTITYEAFKMMLQEDNPEVLRSNNYIDITPEDVTKAYLEYVLGEYIESKSHCVIDKLVVGAPVIWFDERKTNLGRDKLQRVLRSIEGVSEIEIKSEPECACSYFVEEYRKKYNKKYVGKILLIDYGGGTLDISLCEVKDLDTHSEITVRDHWGIIYTGYTIEALAKMNDDRITKIITGLADLIIDGEYIEELNDGRSMIGSSNQNLCYITERYKKDLFLYEEHKRKIETYITGNDVFTIGIPEKGILQNWNNLDTIKPNKELI